MLKLCIMYKQYTTDSVTIHFKYMHKEKTNIKLPNMRAQKLNEQDKKKRKKTA